jgi:hypothetical protein
MAFNVKKQSTHDLAREVADLSGESLAGAVDTALRERRDRLRRKGIAARIIEISDRAAPHVPPGASSSDADELYDELGLPR